MFRQVSNVALGSPLPNLYWSGFGKIPHHGAPIHSPGSPDTNFMTAVGDSTRQSAAEQRYANPGTWKSDAGATALALLPFLGARQTHKAKGPYQQNVKNGIHWLIVHQKPSGEVSRDETRRCCLTPWQPSLCPTLMG